MSIAVPHRRPRRSRSLLSRLLGACALVHLVLVIAWLVLHATVGDSLWWTFLLDSFALYLFAPLVVFLPLALLVRDRQLRLASGVTAVIWVILFGGLFLPPAVRGATASTGRHLVVMTFNVLMYNVSPEGVVASVRRSGADLIGLQEASPTVTDALRRGAADLYPYQLAGPRKGLSAVLLLSRYPLYPTDDHLAGEWTDAPLVTRLMLGHMAVTVLDVHTVSTLFHPRLMEDEARQRLFTAHVIVNFVRANPGPLVMTCDCNTGDESTPYGIVSTALGDSWREAGVGFGNTFPGADSPGSSRPAILGHLVPMWLVRLDYVFHSPDWRVVEAHIGPWDGVSDHRPVVATLALQ